MSLVTYTYPFSATADGTVDGGLLQTQIGAAGITSATLQCINTGNSIISVIWDVPLSAGDKTTLDGVVAAHHGTQTYGGTAPATSVNVVTAGTTTAPTGGATLLQAGDLLLSGDVDLTAGDICWTDG